MAYTHGRVIRRDADPRYDIPKPRNAWSGNYDSQQPVSQYRFGLSESAEVPEKSWSRRRNYSGRRGVEQEHQTMDTDDSDIKDTSMFKKTEELIASIEGLRSLVEQSKDELKAVDKLKLKPSIDNQNQHGNEHQRDENRKLKSDIDKLKEENTDLGNQLEKTEAELQEKSQNLEKYFNDQVGKITDEKKNLSDEMQKIKTENERYKKEFEKIRQSYKQEFDKRNELEQTVKQSNVDLSRLSQECEVLKLRLSNSREKNKSIEKEKKEVETELSESKTRLSRLMGNKLADNNPDIADLSDKNRPTKIAERYAELYDNEWTDTFEAFDESFQDEQKSIQMLLVVLEHIKKHCDKMAQDQAHKLKSAVVIRTDKDDHIPEYVIKQLKDFRRLTAEVSMPEIYQSYIAEVKHLRATTMAQLMSDERVKPFVKGCVELCWLMTVQDPPLVFGPKPQIGDSFDTSVYKHYTQTGAFIEFLVWPTLHLHEGGAMLSKGVAQGYGRAQSAPGRSRSRDGGRHNTAAAIKESVEDRPQTAPPAQNIDRDDKAKVGQTFASSRQDNKHRQSQHNQNYQQHVVSSAHISPNTRFSSTVKDTTGNHSDIHLHSNMSSSVRHGSNVHAREPPASPGTEVMRRFFELRSKFGSESQETKDRFFHQADFQGVGSQKGERKLAWTQHEHTQRPQYKDDGSAGRESPRLVGSQHFNTEQDMDIDEPSSDNRRGAMSLRSTNELFSKLDNLPSLIEHSKNELRAVKQSLLTKLSGEDTELKDELEKMKRENQRLQAQNGDMAANTNYENRIKRLEEELGKTEEARDLIKEKYLEIAGKNKKELEKNETQQQMFEQNKIDMDKMAKECESLNVRLSRAQDLKEQAENAKKRNETELSDCKTRLSRLMGNRLANNNPDIADLSDKNRPTKLAEKNQELYDNDWTNAFEVCQKRFGNEKNTIETLMQMLQDIKTQCDIISKEQEQKLNEAVKLKRTRDSLPEHICKQLKDFRRFTAEASLPEVAEKCYKALSYQQYSRFLRNADVQNFFKGCVELCWLMNAQDPPLVFGETPRRNDAFDGNAYKFYTETGPRVDYIVWPALLLEKGGSLLSKGVAQARGRQQTESPKQEKAESPNNYAAGSGSPMHVQIPPSGQTIDQPKVGKQSRYQYHDYDGAPTNRQRQNVQKQNYEQSVVSGKAYSWDKSKGFNRTTKERDTSSVADTVKKNVGGSQRERLPRKRLPVIPDIDLWRTFQNLVRIYGIDSPEVKEGVSENYNICKDYYIYVFGETTGTTV